MSDGAAQSGRQLGTINTHCVWRVQRKLGLHVATDTIYSLQAPAYRNHDLSRPSLRLQRAPAHGVVVGKLYTQHTSVMGGRRADSIRSARGWPATHHRRLSRGVLDEMSTPALFGMGRWR